MTKYAQMDSNEVQGTNTRLWSRRALLRWGVTTAAVVPALAVAACGRVSAGGPAAPGRQAVEPPEAETAPPTDQPGATMGTGTEGQLPLTPANVDGDDEDLSPTPPQTEGPYFKRNSPERTSLLEAGMAGTRLTLTGRVLTENGQPIARALLDFWQADAAGNYDNAGYRLRGHQFTDDAGQYRLETVIPGLYPGRTRHIHVKVQAPAAHPPDGLPPVLTSQLYFPNEPRNASDGIFDPKLVLPMQATAQGQMATFDFVVHG